MCVEPLGTGAVCSPSFVPWLPGPLFGLWLPGPVIASWVPGPKFASWLPGPWFSSRLPGSADGVHAVEESLLPEESSSRDKFSPLQLADVADRWGDVSCGCADVAEWPAAAEVAGSNTMGWADSCLALARL